MLSSRAAETVIWGMPAVNFQRMDEEFARTVDGGFNEILYWSTLPNWHNQTLTPNPDTTYFMPFFDTTDGPIVIEIPPADDGSITGSLMDSCSSARTETPLLRRGLRSRRRTGHRHGARGRRPIHLDADHHRRSLRARCLLRCGPPYADT
jgi:hypothetical protein